MEESTTTLPLRDTARRRWLEALYARYHHPRFLDSDPIRVLYDYEAPRDREIVGLIAACLAYGNVKAILGGIGNVLRRLGPSPRRYVERSSAERIRADFHDFRYRVTAPADMAGLLVGVRSVVARHGDLHAAFLQHDAGDDPTTLTATAGWVGELCEGAGRPLHHLLPHPGRGSACKRLNLYLRWMVRRDPIDPGGWSGIRPSKLIVPLDTHLHRVALELGLTRRRQPNLRTALEVTEALRQVCPDDPLRYDFALTRPGILRTALTAFPALCQ